MLDENTKIVNRVLLERVSVNLKDNKFDQVYTFESITQAREKILSIIPEESKVGMGGSVTIRQIGLAEELKNRKIIRHEPAMSLKERKLVWREALMADFYIASPQAITIDGKMLFIDKFGNRGAAVIFGPGRVILIAGYNKIVPDLDAAMWRIRNTAAVKNANRLKLGTPCVRKGQCYDCSSEDRICNSISTLLRKPAATDYTIILINEELGF